MSVTGKTVKSARDEISVEFPLGTIYLYGYYRVRKVCGNECCVGISAWPAKRIPICVTNDVATNGNSGSQKKPNSPVASHRYPPDSNSAGILRETLLQLS